MSLVLRAPEPLDATHTLEGFSCGERSLDEWLTRRALANQSTGASRTFVVTDARKQVVGYYALAAGAVAHEEASSNVRRNMPNPVPVLVLGRLAVDQRAQGRIAPGQAQADSRCLRRLSCIHGPGPGLPVATTADLRSRRPRSQAGTNGGRRAPLLPKLSHDDGAVRRFAYSKG